VTPLHAKRGVSIDLAPMRPQVACTSFTFYHQDYNRSDLAGHCFGDSTGTWAPFYSIYVNPMSASPSCFWGNVTSGQNNPVAYRSKCVDDADCSYNGICGDDGICNSIRSGWGNIVDSCIQLPQIRAQACSHMIHTAMSARGVALLYAATMEHIICEQQR